MGDGIRGISWEVFFMDIYEAHGLVEPSRPQEWLILHVGMQRSHEQVSYASPASIVDCCAYEGPTHALAMVRRIDTYPVDFCAFLRKYNVIQSPN
jgi:hypothetical protein